MPDVSSPSRNPSSPARLLAAARLAFTACIVLAVALSVGGAPAAADNLAPSDRSTDCTGGPGAAPADSAAPAAPVISSFDYPRDTWGTVSGHYFRLSGDAGTAGFGYSFDDPDSVPATGSGVCADSSSGSPTGTVAADSDGAASVRTPRLAAGPHVLYARAFDDAHNGSETSSWRFLVAPTLESGETFRREAEVLQPSGDGVASPDRESCDAGCPTFVEGLSDQWAGGKRLRLVAQGPASWTTPSFAVHVEADYAVNAQVTTANDFGQIRFRLNDLTTQQSVVLTPSDGAATVDTYSATPGTENVAFNGLHLDAGRYSMTYEIVATNPSAIGHSYDGTYGYQGTKQVALHDYDDNGYSAGIDYVRVQPINNATYPSFAAAMNNDGISRRGEAAGDVGPDVGRYSYAGASWDHKGFGPGQTRTFRLSDGTSTTFTMPRYNADGTDNVIALQQTIPFTIPDSGTAPAARWIDLLAATTCDRAGSPANGTVQMTVNFGSGSYSDTPVASVPAWTSTATPPAKTSDQNSFVSTVATGLGGRTGTATHSGVNRSLSVVSVPIKGEAADVTSIVLPDLGSNFSRDCTHPNLHVFAISAH